VNLPRLHHVVTSFLLFATGPAGGTAAVDAGDAVETVAQRQPSAARLSPEVPDDPPGVPARRVASVGKTAGVHFGRVTHMQVNVDGDGANIPGDAANEPSIAIDPRDHHRMAIGWRQFDTVSSNFREAGYGYTTDGGQTWTAGKIAPGVFRSDPVLGADAQGSFFYASLSSEGPFVVDFFPSTDGGRSWGPAVFAYGGDKPWFTIDQTGGPGRDHVYEAWSSVSNPTPPNTFDRSTVGGQVFDGPTYIPGAPAWGTLDVASNGTLYVAGATALRGPIVVARSTNARNAGATPTFTTVSVDLGGTPSNGDPNPAGLLGQVWIAVDRSRGPRDGWVYALASVVTPDDPMDVHFARSTDGGLTWSRPVRVNDDPAGNGAMQWFGTMSVAPDGRIDAVWNDTRGQADSWRSALHYAYSTDGGSTWSANEQLSPSWDSRRGWPDQPKIGDYYHMLSDSTGADLAWAATFNGEQDVYYVRIPNPSAGLAREGAQSVHLYAAFPSPFTGSTTVAFDLPPAGAHVRLEVFDPGGRQVAILVDATLEGGRHVTRWDGIDRTGGVAASGLYFCRIQAGGTTETRRMIRLGR